jgi:hypothetical protein
LKDLPQSIADQQLGSPSIIVVGDVVQGIAAWQNQPQPCSNQRRPETRTAGLSAPPGRAASAASLREYESRQSARPVLAQFLADDGRVPAALFLVGLGLQRGHGAGFLSSSTATMVKKQLFTWRTTWLRISSAITLMPISMDDLPVWFTLARKVTSSPTWMGCRNIT